MSPRTNFTGPHSQGPSPADVECILLELHEWRRRAPQKDSRSFPQQNADRVQSTYLQAILLLVRPILVGNTSESINPDLIRLCVDFAVDAAEVSILLSVILFRLANPFPERKSTESEPTNTPRSFHRLSLLLLQHCSSTMLSYYADGTYSQAHSPGH